MYYLNREIIEKTPEGDYIKLLLAEEDGFTDIVYIAKNQEASLITENIVSDEEFNQICNHNFVDIPAARIMKILYEENVPLPFLNKVIETVEQTINYTREMAMYKKYGMRKHLRTMHELGEGKELINK